MSSIIIGTERWLSGRRRRSRKPLSGFSGPGVRISFSPPFIFPFPISGKKRIFYSKALKAVGVKGFAKIEAVCLKHTQNLKKGLFQRKITTSASEF